MPDLLPLVVFDVDGCIADTTEHPPVPRPGITEVFQVVAGLGCEIVVWSGGGEQHARTIVEELALQGYVSHYYRKPEHPPTREDALRILGREPLLQIDDDGTERIPRLKGFLAVDSWWAIRADIAEPVEFVEVERSDEAPFGLACPIHGPLTEHDEGSAICVGCGG